MRRRPSRLPCGAMQLYSAQRFSRFHSLQALGHVAAVDLTALVAASSRETGFALAMDTLARFDGRRD